MNETHTSNVYVLNLVRDLEGIGSFFKLKDRERNNILEWINRITGLKYNICRSDPDNSASPMLLCLGDVIIMEQIFWE